MTIVVNLIAGSGAGKSTTAAMLFALLKQRGVEAELVTEYVKDMVWEGRSKVFECQPYIFGKQLYKLSRVISKVDVVVTDSPIIFSAIYDPEQDPNFRQYILTKFDQFYNLNFFLHRDDIPFNPRGRMESKGEAVYNDGRLKEFMEENAIPFTVFSPKDTDAMLIEVLRILSLHKMKGGYQDE